MNPSPVRNHHGYSLLEVLISAALFAVIVAAVTKFMITMVRSTNDFANRETAVSETARLMRGFRTNFQQILTFSYGANTPYSWMGYPITGFTSNPAFPSASTGACATLDTASCGGVILRQISASTTNPAAPIFQETWYFTQCISGFASVSAAQIRAQTIPGLKCDVAAGTTARVVVRSIPDNTQPSQYTDSYFPAMTAGSNTVRDSQYLSAICIKHACATAGTDSLYVEAATAFITAKGFDVERQRASFPLNINGNSISGSKVEILPNF